MPENVITNPLGTYGYTPTNGRVTEPCRNADTVALAPGDVVVFAMSATTGEATVTKAATGTATKSKFGVAVEAISVGRVGKIAVHGFAYVNVGGNTVAAGDAAQRDGTTAGIAASVTPDATTIAGTLMGTFLAAKGTLGGFSNSAPIFLEKF